jgi:hypothetical protein
MLHKGRLRGLEVRDRDGTVLGKVVDTFPFDGGGDTQFVLVRLRGFGGVHFVPVATSVTHEGELHVPWSKTEIEDAPALDGRRYVVDQAWAARAYWHIEELETLERLAVRGLAARASELLKAQ